MRQTPMRFIAITSTAYRPPRHSSELPMHVAAVEEGDDDDGAEVVDDREPHQHLHDELGHARTDTRIAASENAMSVAIGTPKPFTEMLVRDEEIEAGRHDHAADRCERRHHRAADAARARRRRSRV
jgi:hypothetical protein